MKDNTPDFLRERHDGFSRRRFFRGLGACIALPGFASFAGAASQGKSNKAPTRMAFVYVPNGMIPAAWWPEAVGRDFALSRTLQPLEKVRNQLQVISGLQDLSADAGPDGAGDHARAGGTFLTGVRIKKTAGSDIHAGVSIDQVVAGQIGHLTRFSSLELTCDAVRKAGDCDSGYACAYAYNLAWRSANQPLSPEHNPRFVFERLFGDGARDERVANLKRRQQEQHSILDYVMQDARKLDSKLDGRDRQKLEQYLTSIREIEQRIENSERLKVKNPNIDAPAGVPESYADHIELMFDMLLLAFQTDSTRVATMLIAHEGSNRSFAEINIAEGHHNLTHHKNDAEIIAKVKEIDRWYVAHLAKFLEKMDATQDVDGQSLLHHSMILYGSGNADGNRHTHDNLPIVVAGAGSGAFKPGRYVKTEAAPITNLFLSMADAMGSPQRIESHGDSTGRFV
ncbi:MAG TPA: DUF1552 domain-containing protein [Steroidobacteraceae bacterium]|jgi:hypothetical protein|nr:DUF1552 domain-containing protein [Steroidobacteraceae bacterium]